MENRLYHYRAFVVSVYDGDTITVNIDLGLKTSVNGEKIRLHRINAPEVRGKEREVGLKSRDRLRELVLNKNILLETVKDRRGKYGRYLGEIWVKLNGNKYTNINDLLVKEGFAEYKEY